MASTFAARFHALHADGMLLLANAWDAGSARLAQAAGARAVATSSAAVAWAHCWPDGDRLPAERLVATARSIVGAIDVPLSVDMEGGYSDDPERVGALVAELVAEGVVGINLEDGGGDPSLLCAKIAAARRAAVAADVDLFINARTDVWLRGLADAPGRAAEAIARGRRYAQAGASGLFVPGILDADDIAKVVAGVALPVNVLAWPGMMDASRLAALGVRRYSAGSAIAEAANGLVAAMMREFTASGRIDDFGVAPLSWSQANAAMERR